MGSPSTRKWPGEELLQNDGDGTALPNVMHDAQLA
jgi:hypothetical protein